MYSVLSTYKRFLLRSLMNDCSPIGNVCSSIVVALSCASAYLLDFDVDIGYSFGDFVGMIFFNSVQRYKKFLTFASDSARNACFLSGLNILLHWGGICSPHISNFLFFPYNSPLSPQNSCKSQYISVLLCIHFARRTDGQPTVNRRSADSQGWRQASVRLLSPRKMAKNCSTNTILYIYI